MKMLKWIWRLLKLTRSPIFAALLIASLSLNFALFTGGAVYNVASSAFEHVTGRHSVASQHVDELATHFRDLDVEKKANTALRGELASTKLISQELHTELAGLVEELDTKRQANNELRGELVSAKLISQDLRNELARVNRRNKN